MAKKDKNPAPQEKETVASGVSKKFKQNPALYIGSVVILILVVVTFVGGDLLSGGRFGRVGSGDFTFGHYDKTPISWVPGNIFSQYYEQVVHYYRSYGVDANDSRYAAQIWRQAYEATAVHIAILQIMKKSNYIIPDKTVDRNVAQLPQFQDNGRFSPALYNQMSDNTRRALWKQTQEDLIKAAYHNDMFNTLISSSEADFIAEMASNSRSFDMVSFKVDNYPDSEYRSFAQENTELFGMVHLSRITVNNEREAGKILESIKNGTTLFEDAARSHSQDSFADRGGDIGPLYFYELDQEIPNIEDRRIIANLAKGTLSDVVNMGGGWAVFRIEEEIIMPNFDDEAVMEKVRSYIRNFQRGKMEDWALAQAADFIAEAEESGFDNAARWRNLDKQSFGPLPINYGSVDLFTALESFTISGFTPQELGNIARNENFWNIAFSAGLNTPSQPLVQGNNVLVLYPTEEIKADEDAVMDIKSKYSTYWVNNTVNQSFQPYFLNHEKMDDTFWDTYFRIFMP